MRKNWSKRFIAITICSVFLTSGCALTPHIQSEEYKQVELLAQPFDWAEFLADERKIPSVEKMDGWQYMIHKAKELDPQILDIEGEELICHTSENYREVVKQLYHGRLGWDIAAQMQKGWEQERELKHYAIKISKLDGLQMKKVLALWTMAEDRNQKLERKIMIDGVLHKITVIGLVAGAILFAIIAL
ncbi:MAG: hypothetical protein GQ553_00280 [Nitrosomonadaceae bacterium]|nr:hypothetical protein [Nitrosomonadaceae bacterium]